MDDRTRGGVFAFLAFLAWGLFPLYFREFSGVPALEILAHRAVWVLVSLWPIILLLGWGRRVKAVFKDRRTLRHVVWSTSLLTVNWLIFIWAMTHDHVLQSSVGYYINPLLTVLLGVLILGERLRRIQWFAVWLAGTGVGVMVYILGELPWVALSLALTFALYGLARKQTPVDAMTGLFAETMIVSPIAVIYLAWLLMDGSAVVGPDSGALLYLVIGSGAVTAAPLVLFAAGARRLPLSMVGFFQYLTPTGHFVLAVFVFGEPFSHLHLVSFALIWAAIALYTTEAFRHRSNAQRSSDS